MQTSFREKSSIPRTLFGLALAVRIPSSQTANAITATEFLGKRPPISGRLDSPLASPGYMNTTSFRSDRACEPVCQEEFDAGGLDMAGQHGDARIASGH